MIVSIASVVLPVAGSPTISALGDDRVDRQRGLAGGRVTHDQLALPAPQGEQRIDHQHPGLHGFGHQIAVDDAGRVAFHGQGRLRHDRALAVQRAAQRVDDPAQQARPHRHAHHLARAVHRIPRLKRMVGVQQHAADAVGLQHLGKADGAGVEPQQLVQPHIGQARDHRHAVGDLLDPAAVSGVGAQPGGLHPGGGVVQPGDIMRHRR